MLDTGHPPRVLENMMFTVRDWGPRSQGIFLKMLLSHPSGGKKTPGLCPEDFAHPFSIFMNVFMDKSE